MRTGPALLALLAACAGPGPFHGPLPVRNQHPAQLTVLGMDPRSARVLPGGTPDLRVDAAYSSLFQGDAGAADRFVMDGEILRSSLKARIGLGHGLEAFSELAFAHTSGGFLDDFLIEWHRFLGVDDQDRPANPRDVWEVRAERGSNTVYEMEEVGFEVLDLPVGLAWNPWAGSEAFQVLLRGAVELPLGADEEGFGNGEPDYSIGLVGEYRFEGWVLTGHVQHTFAGTPDRAAAGGFGFADVSTVGLGAELALGRWTSALVQSSVESSTLRDLDVEDVARAQWLLTVGLRHALGDGFYLEAAVIEDLSPNVAPDVTGYVGFGWSPALADAAPATGRAP